MNGALLDDGRSSDTPNPPWLEEPVTKTKLSKPLRSLALPLVAVLLSLTTVAAAQTGFISTVAGTGTPGFNGDRCRAGLVASRGGGHECTTTLLQIKRYGELFEGEFYHE